MTASRVNARRHWRELVSLGLAVLLLGAYALIGTALHRISAQSKFGGQAHTRQCATLPGSTKMTLAAYSRGEISQADVDRFMRTRPTGC